MTDPIIKDKKDFEKIMNDAVKMTCTEEGDIRRCVIEIDKSKINKNLNIPEKK